MHAVLLESVGGGEDLSLAVHRVQDLPHLWNL